MSGPGKGPGASRHTAQASTHWLASSSSLHRHRGGKIFSGSFSMLSQHFHGLACCSAAPPSPERRMSSLLASPAAPARRKKKIMEVAMATFIFVPTQVGDGMVVVT
uniref:Uncharacterized protein n=1 Tax=Oryza brachyantha TaxID=4533 RepID=J3KVZ3_ORYBR